LQRRILGLQPTKPTAANVPTNAQPIAGLPAAQPSAAGVPLNLAATLPA